MKLRFEGMFSSLSYGLLFMVEEPLCLMHGKKEKRTWKSSLCLLLHSKIVLYINSFPIGRVSARNLIVRVIIELTLVCPFELLVKCVDSFGVSLRNVILVSLNSYFRL